MPGFDTDQVGGGGLVYCTNVDFTGTSFTAGTRQVTADGQLLIGSSVTPNIRVGSLASADGSVTITTGHGTINLKGFSSLNDLHVAKWIVNQTPGAGGNATTIGSALASALPGDTIFVMPGTYTENLTLKAGVNITAFDCDANGAQQSATPNVTIIGTLTATFTGTCCLSGLNLQTNSATVLTVSGANATEVILSECFISATNNNAISLTSSGGSNIYLLYCNGNISGAAIHYFDVASTNGQLYIYYGNYQNTAGSTSSNTVSSAGRLFGRFVSMSNHFTTSNTASVDLQQCFFTNGTTGCIINGTGGGLIRYSRFETGTAVGITIGAGVEVDVDYLSIQSSNANALNGTGTIKYGVIAFDGTSSKNNVTTQTPYVEQAVTTAISQLVYSTTNNVLAGLTAANSASLVSNSTGVPVWSGTMTNGQIIIGSTGATPTAATLTAGTGITISNAGGSITINSTGGLTWTDNSGTFTAASNNGYFITAASTPTLPAAPNEGDEVSFILDAAATVTITGNTGQKIRIGNTISAAAGTCAASVRGSAVDLIYRTTGTTWFANSAPEGTWTLT
jgi:hypothetical protein